MLVNRRGMICHISKTETPYQLWYPISLLIPRFGDDYIEEKLGVTSPDHVKRLQDEFLEALATVSKGNVETLESFSIRFDKHDWDFYLADKTENSVTVYLEMGLTPDKTSSQHIIPHGNVWARISKKDSPDTLGEKLYTTNKLFARALYNKLWEMMGW